MSEKRFAAENLPEEVQAKAERMNLDESAVGAFTIPPLPLDKQTTPEEFSSSIRPLLLSELSRYMYGPIPPPCEEIRFLVRSEGVAFEGLALRREIDIVCRHRGLERILHLLLYIPQKSTGKVPVFFGLNFRGNIATSSDPGVTFHPFERYPSLGTIRYADRRVDESKRGTLTTGWEFERVLKRGFAAATMCYYDLYPDRPDGFEKSIMRMFYTPEQWNSPERETGAISAWAWGIQRAIDCLCRQAELDPAKIIVHGHSRLGKTALWAGANDSRIALTVSNCSGTCGAKLAHRNFGENFEWINHWNPHWLRASFDQYTGKDQELPIDQHFLMAAIAPRLLYVASAENDLYADPKGEFLAAFHASPAWKIFGKKGLDSATFPAPGRWIGNQVGYFLRTGEHSFLPENWEALLDFTCARIMRH